MPFLSPFSSTEPIEVQKARKGNKRLFKLKKKDNKLEVISEWFPECILFLTLYLICVPWMFLYPISALNSHCIFSQRIIISQ